MGTLTDDLRAREPDVELRETHISRVFLGAREVLKIKKPVDLGFLDFSSLERRRAACTAEVELNRRLAPDVYLGVVPITRDRDGRHAVDGAGEVVEYAVHMRRLPDEWRADLRLERGALTGDQLRLVMDQLAAFHERARADEFTARFGAPEHIAVNLRENFEQAGARARALLDAQSEREIEARQLGFLERAHDLLARRVAGGRVRDGHGDLRLEHVYINDDGDVHIIDCIEFNDRFRYGDVCADIAFLSMDLAMHGRVDLAELALARYAEVSGDFELYGLVDFYEGYRAFVRGKIATLTAADDSVSLRERERASALARRYFLLALAAQRAPLVPPRVVAVGGVIATGKSTIAAQLSVAMGAPIVSSDRTRKQLLKVAPTRRIADSSWSGAYSVDFTRRVYEEVSRRAAAVLAAGRPVILDASFRTRAMRAQARELARERGVPFQLVECRAPIEVIRARLVERSRGASVSDGRLEILEDFLAKWEGVDELAPEEHIVLDSAQPLARSLAALRERVPVWPAGRAP